MHSPGGSKWASTIVVLRKSDWDIRICGDYEIDVNHKVCSDSYPILNVKAGIHAMTSMSVFTKIDLKTAYHQIDDNFKEVTTINTPIGLLKWRRMPYGIKTATGIFQRTIQQVLDEVKFGRNLVKEETTQKLPRWGQKVRNKNKNWKHVLSKKKKKVFLPRLLLS